jgi:hypothetical protein
MVDIAQRNTRVAKRAAEQGKSGRAKMFLVCVCLLNQSMEVKVQLSHGLLLGRAFIM